MDNRQTPEPARDHDASRRRGWTMQLVPAIVAQLVREVIHWLAS